MKEIKTYIIEKLKVSSKVLSTHTFTLFPKSKEELEKIIKAEISKNGNKCSLNHIDVSKITDMSGLFFGSKFNGDISDWDVSNVTDMDSMFYNSNFNGDISNWDVSNVTTMREMFKESKFNKDIIVLSSSVANLPVTKDSISNFSSSFHTAQNLAGVPVVAYLTSLVLPANTN